MACKTLFSCLGRAPCSGGRKIRLWWLLHYILTFVNEKQFKKAIFFKLNTLYIYKNELIFKRHILTTHLPNTLTFHTHHEELNTKFQGLFSKKAPFFAYFQDDKRDISRRTNYQLFQRCTLQLYTK